MDALDRLGWAAGFSFLVGTLPVGIRVSDAAVLEYLPAYLPNGRQASQEETVERLYSLIVGGSEAMGSFRRFHLLYVGETRCARHHHLPPVLSALETDLRVYLSERSHGEPADLEPTEDRDCYRGPSSPAMREERL